jgi:hypothetical protein
MAVHEQPLLPHPVNVIPSALGRRSSRLGRVARRGPPRVERTGNDRRLQAPSDQLGIGQDE